MGATPGGVKDMKLARELVANGQVPPPDALLVEGMFSEHDLALEGPACDRTLCLRGALGAAPALDGADSAWLQVGLSSNVDPEAFQRPPLALVFTVDVSGSMGWNYSQGQNEYPTPGELARMLMRAVAAKLTGDDRAAVVAYGSDAETVLGAVAGSDARLRRAIDSLEEGGSTNMEAGMTLAYQVARGMRGGGREVRLVLFTDTQPNVGATGSGAFRALAEQGAADGIGLTVMGLGLGLGAETTAAMSQLRGGNAFTLTRRSEVDDLMAESWPFLAAPVAFDLSLDLVPGSGFAAVESYGFPPDPSAGSRPTLSASTVFLSRRRGALLVRLQPGAQPIESAQIAGTLAYATPDGRRITQDLGLSFDSSFARDAGGRYFQQHSVGRAVALAMLVAGMKQAAEHYTSERAEAVAGMERTAARFHEEAAALADEDLQPEIDFTDALLRLMRQGAPQGTLYGMRGT